MKIAATLFVSIVLALGFIPLAEVEELLSIEDRKELLLFVEKDIFQFSEKDLFPEKDQGAVDNILDALRSDPSPEVTKEEVQNYMDRLSRLKEILDKKGLQSPALEMLLSDGRTLSV